MNGMAALGRALQTEIMKLRRTLALWLTLIIPAAVLLLVFLRALDQPEWFGQNEDGAWMTVVGQTLLFWSALMLPLFTTLETALVAGLDHNSGRWKDLFSLPIPRWTVFAAKMICSAGLLALSSLILAMGMILMGIGLHFVLPATGLDLAIPWLVIFKTIGLCYLSSMLIIAISAYIALRWSSFVVASGAGIIAAMGTVFTLGSDWSRLYPWSFPFLAVQSVAEGPSAWQQLLFGGLAALALAAAGCWRLARRDVTF